MIYVTADLHGMAPEAFDGLLAKGGVGPADTVFILGDVLDRGEHGVGQPRAHVHVGGGGAHGGDHRGEPGRLR